MALSWATGAKAQNECSCSPARFEFTFNLTNNCGDGYEFGDGVQESTCFTSAFSTNVTNVSPVEVQRISIVETDLLRVPIAQSQLQGTFVDGDNFVYSSVSGLGGDSGQIPQSIQLTLTGVNLNGGTIVQVWAIRYSNDCLAYPVLELEDSIGWTTFTDLGVPRPEFCSVVDYPSSSPTMSPAPTTPAPTPNPTLAPTTTSPTTAEMTSLPTNTLHNEEPSSHPSLTTKEPTMQTSLPTLRPIPVVSTSEPTTLNPIPVVSASRPTLRPTSRPKGYKDEIREPTTYYDYDNDDSPPFVMSYALEYDDLEEMYAFGVAKSSGQSKKEKKKKDLKSKGTQKVLRVQQPRHHLVFEDPPR